MKNQISWNEIAFALMIKGFPAIKRALDKEKDPAMKAKIFLIWADILEEIVS